MFNADKQEFLEIEKKNLKRIQKLKPKVPELVGEIAGQALVLKPVGYMFAFSAGDYSNDNLRVLTAYVQHFILCPLFSFKGLPVPTGRHFGGCTLFEVGPSGCEPWQLLCEFRSRRQSILYFFS